MSLEKAAKPQMSLLFLLVSFGSVGAVLFTPALPSIQAFFHLSVGKAQLTITAYLLGYSLGQLPYGPLANGIGRKKTLLAGLCLAVIGSLLCALSAVFHSFALLVFARFLQALGSCVGLKISFTMIADVYDQTTATKKISHMMMAFAIMPGVATTIGGYITQIGSWEGCFYFLALFGLLMLCLSTYLPETAKTINKTALNLSSIIQGYREKLKNTKLLLSGFMMGSGSAIVYIFASKSPFIGITVLKLSPEMFGILNLIPPIGMFAGSFLAAYLAGRFAVSTLLLMGITASFAATFFMLIPFAMDRLSLWSLFLPMTLIYAAESIVFANSSSLGLSHAKNKSNASAVINCINLITAVAAVFLSQAIFPDSALLMPISFLFFFMVMFVLWLKLKTFTSPGLPFS